MKIIAEASKTKTKRNLLSESNNAMSECNVNMRRSITACAVQIVISCRLVPNKIMSSFSRLFHHSARIAATVQCFGTESITLLETNVKCNIKIL